MWSLEYWVRTQTSSFHLVYFQSSILLKTPSRLSYQFQRYDHFSAAQNHKIQFNTNICCRVSTNFTWSHVCREFVVWSGNRKKSKYWCIARMDTVIIVSNASHPFLFFTNPDPTPSRKHHHKEPHKSRYYFRNTSNINVLSTTSAYLWNKHR